MDKKYYIIGGVLILLLLVAGVLFVSSSGSNTKSSNQKITLVWWKTFEDGDNVQGLISDYEKLHKNVTIDYVKQDDTTYEQDLLNALASGQGPDIFTIHNDWLPKYSDKLAPMPPELMSLRTYQSTFADVATSDFVKDSQIYAVPLATDELALYYNKDLLGSAGIAQPPTTWPELVADVEKLTKVAQAGTFSESGVAMGTSANVNRAVDILSLLMLQNGTQFYSDDLGTATFDQTQPLAGSSQTFNPGLTALQFYTQFADPSNTAYTWNTNSDDSVDAFAQGKVAMMINYSYMIPTIQARSPNLNWATAPVPQINDTDPKVNFANYWGEGVSKASKNQAAAWDFLNFITQKTELESYYKLQDQPASRKDILAEQQTDPTYGVFADEALTARSVYKPDADEFESVFLKMIDDVTLNNVSATNALNNAAEQINLSLHQ